MALQLYISDEKNDDFIDMREILLRSIRENLLDVNVYERVKTRKNLKTPNSFDHIIYMGCDLVMVVDLLNNLINYDNMLILYNPPGYSIYPKLSEFLDECLGRHKYVFDYTKRIFDTWNHREIISLLSTQLKVKQQEYIKRLDEKLKMLNNENTPDDQLLIGDPQDLKENFSELIG